MEARRTHLSVKEKRVRNNIACKKHQRKMIAMGFKSGKLPTAYVKQLAYATSYHRGKGLASHRAAWKKYDDKLSSMFGTHSRTSPKVRAWLATRQLDRERRRKELAAKCQ